MQFIISIPVIMIESRAFRECNDEGRFQLTFELQRALFRDPHEVNFILPATKSLEEMALPIEAESGVIETNVVAFLRLLVRRDAEDSTRGLFINTTGLICARCLLLAACCLLLAACCLLLALSLLACFLACLLACLLA